jgi:hypothetical protein
MTKLDEARYRWQGEDSTFEGVIVARYTKRNGKRMVVLEDDRGLNHIYPDNPARLVRIDTEGAEGVKMDPWALIRSLREMIRRADFTPGKVLMYGPDGAETWVSPTPPAEGSDGGEAVQPGSWDDIRNGLIERDARIADLEARLAEEERRRRECQETLASTEAHRRSAVRGRDDAESALLDAQKRTVELEEAHRVAAIQLAEERIKHALTMGAETCWMKRR